MTTVFDRISEAWRSGEPGALHHITEQLAAQGVEETALYDALERLLLEQRVAGANDEVEERITDVMARLTDWGHESNQIRTANTPPADEEIDLIEHAGAARARGAAVSVPSDVPPTSST